MIILLFIGLFSPYLLAESPVDTKADSFEQQAYLLYNRIAGVPPDPEVLTMVSELLAKGKKGEAALLATKDPAFYNVKLRNMFSGWSNVSDDISGNLNDMVATMIGMVRDDLPFNEVLSADLVYVADEAGVTAELDEPPVTRMGKPRNVADNRWQEEQPGFPSYSLTDNQLYEYLQQSDLQKNLSRAKQSQMPEPLDNRAIAGVLSTRAFGEAFFSAGTNRRATAFVLKNFLCHNMEELHDVNAGGASLGGDQYVRQDVDRTPGGDSDLFRSRCLGCHAGMDAMSGWSVYYDYNNRSLVYNKGLVQEKVRRNKYRDDPGFVAAYTPKDDSFENIWVKGANAQLGWGTKTSGSGAAEWGQMITASKAFARCMVTQAYNAVCFKAPETTGEQEVVKEITELFIADNYQMRNMIAATAVSCLIANNEATSDQQALPKQEDEQEEED